MLSIVINVLETFLGGKASSASGLYLVQTVIWTLFTMADIQDVHNQVINATDNDGRVSPVVPQTD